MREMGLMLIIGGAIMLVVGLLFFLGPGMAGLHWLGRLPGDVRVEKPGFSFYFPITTSIIVSIILSAVLFLISRFR